MTQLKNSRSTHGLSRRLLLRGAGVAMALPWLESMPVWSSETPAQDYVIPQRFGALFMACGVNADHWWAKDGENGMELGKSLAPMEPLKNQMNFIDGLFNKNATDVGIHPGQTGNILSGASLQKGSELRGGISVDQVIANHLGQDNAQPSMVLGCEQPITGYHETNFSMAYSSHISWQNATSPVPMEVYPALAFDSLFDNRSNLRNRSVLDRVKEDAGNILRKTSASDRVKLDEYMSSVRDVEKRIERMRDQQDQAVDRSKSKSVPLAFMDRPDNGLPEDIREHMRLMCDIVALGFQTDKTRVATLLLCRDISGLFYPFLDVRNAHHSASHNDLSEDFHKVTEFYVSQFAYLTDKLSKMPEGDATVLDHSCLLFLNNMWSGSKHDSSKVPLLTCGGLSGKIKTGRVLDYAKKPDEERKLCSLYLSIMNGMGLANDKFGDAAAPLEGF